MCFSAEASLGVAVGLLPVGAYCAEAAWRKNRAYLPFAFIPVLFGLQQLCEARVWIGFGRGDMGAVRQASLGFLFFGLFVWPVWIPLAVAAVEPVRWRRRAFGVFAGVGALCGIAYYLPFVTGCGPGAEPDVVGHSIRYDFSDVPVARSPWGWVWAPLCGLTVVVPLLASWERYLRPLGLAIGLSAGATYILSGFALAFVWCFFATVSALYLSYLLYRLPAQPAGVRVPEVRPWPSN